MKESEMFTVSFEEAIAGAENHLNEISRKKGFSNENIYVILRDHVIDKGDYWCIHYQSEEFIKTGEITKRLAGNWPLKVSKSTGAVIGVETPEWMANVKRGQ